MVGLGSSGNAEQSRLDFESELAFITLTGENLKVCAKQLSLAVTGEDTLCTLSLEVEWSVYQQLITGEWMGLLAKARSGESDKDFNEDQPIELRVILRPGFLKIAFRNGTEIEQVLQTLLQDSEDARILRQSECWLVTEVKQQMNLPEELNGGTLKRGYRTLWAESTAARPASNETRPTLNEVVEGYLDSVEIQYEWMNETILCLSYTGEQGTWVVLVRTDEEKQICVVYSVYPETVPKEHQAGMAVFLTEENYDLTVGSFELDTTDGELRYRTSIDVENDRLTKELFGQLFTTNVVIMDHYFNVLHDGIQQGFPG